MFMYTMVFKIKHSCFKLNISGWKVLTRNYVKLNQIVHLGVQYQIVRNNLSLLLVMLYYTFLKVCCGNVLYSSFQLSDGTVFQNKCIFVLRNTIALPLKGYGSKIFGSIQLIFAKLTASKSKNLNLSYALH